MASSDVAAGGMSGASSGMMMGAALGSVVPGLGTIAGGAIGTVLGGLGGSLLGGKKKKAKAPARASGAVYGYDTYGNLVNKGTYAYNPATGVYELKAGELSGPEKAMRQNLAGNIANLINTVGTTPDAFVRYAKELSDSYYKQGERKLAENVATEQAKLDESLARRGLSTSRAAADVQSEFERRRQNTLADIYDAAQRYGYTVQSGLQSQANQAMNTLAGYQGQLMGQDQSYLQQALAAQAQGQAYENAKAGVENQNIAQQNANYDSMLGSLSQLGSLAGYGLATGAFGSSAANMASSTPQWMQQGTQWATEGMNLGNVGTSMNTLAAQYTPTANIAGLGTTNYLAGYYNPLKF